MAEEQEERQSGTQSSTVSASTESTAAKEEQDVTDACEGPADAAGDMDAMGEDPEQVVQLTAELEAQKEAYQQLHERFLRLQAEFDNFRRRTRREADEIRQRAAEELAAALLPVVDNLERATMAAQGTDGAPKGLVDGVEMVLRQLLMELEKVGVVPIDAEGNPFDPNVHEAVAHEETDEYPDGHVMEVLQKGYLLKDKVLRPSMVKVARSSSEQGGHNQ